MLCRRSNPRGRRGVLLARARAAGIWLPGARLVATTPTSTTRANGATSCRDIGSIRPQFAGCPMTTMSVGPDILCFPMTTRTTFGHRKARDTPRTRTRTRTSTAGQLPTLAVARGA
eukprot:1209794-Pyramimonas_sp.AAC.1